MYLIPESNVFTCVLFAFWGWDSFLALIIDWKKGLEMKKWKKNLGPGFSYFNFEENLKKAFPNQIMDLKDFLTLLQNVKIK